MIEKAPLAALALTLFLTFTASPVASAGTAETRLVAPNGEKILREGEAVKPESADFSSLGWVAAFDEMHKKFTREYPYTDWKGVDWDSARRSVRKRIAAAEKKNDAEAYYTLLREYFLRAEDGHVTVANREMLARARERYAGGYGFAVAEAEDGSFVAHVVLGDGQAAIAGMKPGAKIVSWNGVPFRSHARRVPIAFSDRREIPATAAALALERYRLAVRAAAGTKAKITFKNPGEAAARTIELTACGDEFATAERGNFLSQASLTEPPTDYKVLPGGYGYIRNRCLAAMGETGPVEMEKKVVGPFTAAMEEFAKKGVRGVIVDLRGNRGGVDVFTAEMAGHFFKKRAFYEYRKMFNYRTKRFDLLDEFFGPAVLYSEPRAPYYDGPLVLLVNPATISSGEGMPMMALRLKNARVVGFYGTNGSFGMVDGVRIALPGGNVIMYPTGMSCGEDGEIQLDSRDGEGGVAPSARVPRTVENLVAFGNGIDVELNFAMNVVEALCKKAAAKAKKTGGEAVPAEKQKLLLIWNPNSTIK